MRKLCQPVIVENFFEPCLLYLLLKNPSYGYELNKDLKNNCECQVNIGNLYRGLDRLVKTGCVTKKKSDSDLGPAKIIYKITPKGKTHLATWIKNLEKQNQIIGKLVTNYKKIL